MRVCMCWRERGNDLEIVDGVACVVKSAELARKEHFIGIIRARILGDEGGGGRSTRDLTHFGVGFAAAQRNQMVIVRASECACARAGVCPCIYNTLIIPVAWRSKNART